VLAQFARDGGNREQALNYQLYSFEFCWQARMALQSAGRQLALEVEERVKRAAGFFVVVQAESDYWDYGDSDSAFVTPFFDKDPATEWRQWFAESNKSPALQFWLGEAPQPKISAEKIASDWTLFPETGIAVNRTDDWFLRFDLSPLGYLSTAAHGHLDALHLSIWFKDVALIVDPGTGAYYADKELRSYLASWNAHNPPHPGDLNFPKRLGPFLWSEHHARPEWESEADALIGSLKLPSARLQRNIRKLQNGWQVEDACHGGENFVVHWQFAPGTALTRIGAHTFSAERKNIKITIELSANWKIETEGAPTHQIGTVSPSFRNVTSAPWLRLVASSQPGDTFYTLFTPPLKHG
ncbi:MAG: heparinase II/III family protein, partial [Limisphaerales bacterium]